MIIISFNKKKKGVRKIINNEELIIEKINLLNNTIAILEKTIKIYVFNCSMGWIKNGEGFETIKNNPKNIEFINSYVNLQIHILIYSLGL